MPKHSTLNPIAFLYVLCVGVSASQPLGPTCPADDDGTPNPYPIYWNVGGAGNEQTDIIVFHIQPENRTQTGEACTQQGVKCQAWQQGVWPRLEGDNKPVNGGVPQAGNLTLHLDYIEQYLPLWLPDPLWNGNAVLDFEAWTTVWDLNEYEGYHWHGKDYQLLSMELVRQAHPSWNETQVMVEAKKQFETAATEWFVETLQTCVKIRPHARWGFYGLPVNDKHCVCLEACEGKDPVYQCGYNIPGYGDKLRSYSDQQQPVWAASTALFPSIYLPPGHTGTPNWYRAYVNSTVTETMRCAAMTSSKQPLPVLPFHWNKYHNGSTLLTPTDLVTGLLDSYGYGASGVVVWGSEAQSSTSFAAYVHEHVGPVASAFTKAVCDCSRSQCNSHGRCRQAPINASTSVPMSPQTCQCYEGFSGDNCETRK